MRLLVRAGAVLALGGFGLAMPADWFPALAHDALVAKHATTNGIPESLVRRVIQKESRGNARAVSKGNYGLMQIRLGTAKAMGYRGGADGLLDADTNMTYAVKYLAGAYRAAGGNPDRAMALYQRGYYAQAKVAGFSPYGEAATPTRRRAAVAAIPATTPTSSEQAAAAAKEIAVEESRSGEASSDVFAERFGGTATQREAKAGSDRVAVADPAPVTVAPIGQRLQSASNSDSEETRGSRAKRSRTAQRRETSKRAAGVERAEAVETRAAAPEPSIAPPVQASDRVSD